MVVLNIGDDFNKANEYIGYNIKNGPELMNVLEIKPKEGWMIIENATMTKFFIHLATVIKIGNSYILWCENKYRIWVQLLNKIITSDGKIVSRKDGVIYREQKERFEKAKRYNSKSIMVNCGALHIYNNKVLANMTENSETFYVPALADAINTEFNSKTYSKKLKKVNIEANIDISKLGYYFSGIPSLESVRMRTKSKVIPDGMFKDCPNLKKVQILGNIESIGMNAFARCTSLENLEIEGRVNVGKVETGAFFKCKKLEEPKFLPKVKLVGVRAFLQCERFRNIEIGKDAMISGYAFAGCKNLESMKIKSTKASTNFGLYGDYPNLVISCPRELGDWIEQYHSFKAKEIRCY